MNHCPLITAFRGWIQRIYYKRRLEEKKHQHEHEDRFLHNIETVGNSVYANQMSNHMAVSGEAEEYQAEEYQAEDDSDSDSDYNDTLTQSTNAG